MNLCKVQLRNSILGWGLYPVSEGSEKILTKLYCQEYDTLKRREVCCLRGTVKEVLAEVKKVAKEMGMRVSACGKKGAPTLRVWGPKPETELSGEVSVDLKWSLWSQDQEIWEQYAPGVWERMRDAFLGKTGPLMVRTAPRKEIHFGTVTVSKGTAKGVFTTEWDELEGLAETLGVECDDLFRECVPFTTENMAPGVAWDFDLKARKFGSLMRRVDEENSTLLERDERAWKSLEESFKENGDE
jgi:hypothetical protein